jgi:hypothetical protein
MPAAMHLPQLRDYPRALTTLAIAVATAATLIASLLAT